MNRRGFLTLFASAAIAARLPLSWVPTAKQEFVAIQFLTTIWNTNTKGLPAGKQPKTIYVSAQIHYMLHGELNTYARFAKPKDERTTRFKSVAVVTDPALTGYQYRMV